MSTAIAKDPFDVGLPTYELCHNPEFQETGMLNLQAMNLTAEEKLQSIDAVLASKEDRLLPVAETCDDALTEQDLEQLRKMREMRETQEGEGEIWESEEMQEFWERQMRELQLERRRKIWERDRDREVQNSFERWMEEVWKGIEEVCKRLEFERVLKMRVMREMRVSEMEREYRAIDFIFAIVLLFLCFLKSACRTCSPDSLTFGDKYVSIILFHGAWVWIKSRDVWTRPYERHGKFEPRVYPRRRTRFYTLGGSYLSVGSYKTRQEALDVGKIAACYLEETKDIVEEDGHSYLDLGHGRRFRIPPLRKEGWSLCGKRNQELMKNEVENVYQNFTKEKAANNILNADAGEQSAGRDSSHIAEPIVIPTATNNDARVVALEAVLRDACVPLQRELGTGQSVDPSLGGAMKGTLPDSTTKFFAAEFPSVLQNFATQCSSEMTIDEIFNQPKKDSGSNSCGQEFFNSPDFFVDEVPVGYWDASSAACAGDAAARVIRQEAAPAAETDIFEGEVHDILPVDWLASPFGEVSQPAWRGDAAAETDIFEVRYMTSPFGLVSHPAWRGQPACLER